MPRHVVIGEVIVEGLEQGPGFVEPGQTVPITLTYSTEDSEGSNAGSFAFAVAVDSSALILEDTDPNLEFIQLGEEVITEAFDFGVLGAVGARPDENNLDRDDTTDTIINFAYVRTPPLGEDDWPFGSPDLTEGATEVPLGTIQIPTAADFTGTRVNVVLAESDSDFDGDAGAKLDPVLVKAADGVPNHAVDAILTSGIVPGEGISFNLRYSTEDLVRANAGSFSFSVAVDSSVLAVEDIDPNLDLIQLGEGVITEAFDFGVLGAVGARADVDNLDGDDTTDTLINFAYVRTPPLGEDDWPFGSPDVPAGQDFVDLATVNLPLSANFDPETQTTAVNVVLGESDANFQGNPGDILDQLVLPAPLFDQDQFTFTVDENSPVDTVVGQVTATHADSDEPLTFSITGNVDPDGDGTNAFAINANTGEITVADSDDLDFEQNESFTLTVQVSDNGPGPSAAETTVTINLNDIDETTPVFDGAPFTFDVVENSAVDTVVGTVVANDVEPDVNPLTFSITGNVDPDGDGTNAFAINPNSGEITVADSGDLELDPEQDQSFEVTVAVTDGTNATETTVTINVVNDPADDNQPPVFDVDPAQAIDENTTLVVEAVASDPDGDDLTFSISAGADAGLFAIDENGNLSFNAAPDFETPADANGDNVYEVQVSVDDGVETVTQDFQVTVNDVNEAPVAADDTATTDEDTILEVAIDTRQVIAAELLNDPAADGEANIELRYSTVNPPRANAQVFNFEVAVDSSQFVLEDTNPDLDRIQLSEDTFLEGFEFGSLFAESGVPSASADTEDIDNDPTTDTVITFAYLRLEEDWPFGSPDIPAEQEFVDLGTLSLPVSDAFNETTANVVLREPDANFEGNPGDLITTIAIPSGETDPALASNLLVNDSDPDEGDTLTISAVNGEADNVGTEITLASGALLTVNADGSYIFDPNGAFESLAVGDTEDVTFTYTVSDDDGLTDSADVTITVEGVNDAPEIVAPDPFEFTFTEPLDGVPADGGNPDAPVQIEINLLDEAGEALAADEIAAGDSFFVEIVAAADDPSGISTLSLNLDFDPAVFNVLSDFADPAVIVTGFPDARPAGLELPTATLTDGQITLSGGSFNADNAIGADGVSEQFALIEFEAIADPTNATLDLEFPGIDENGNPIGGSLGDGTALEDVELNVQDFTFSDQGGGDSLVVGTIEAEDIDEGDVLTFSLTGGADEALFTIDPVTGELSFNEAPDFEEPADANADNVYEVEVTVDDGNGGTDVDTLLVRIEDVEENLPPVFDVDPAQSIDENTTLVVEAVASDPDAEDTLTFSLSGGADQGFFTINADGDLSFNEAPDFEDPQDADGDNVYEVQVTVTDGEETVTQDFEVTVEDVNEAPVFDTDAEQSIDENETEVVTVEAEDPEGDDLTFSISDGADRNLFEIDPNTGDLRFIAAPDFENPQDADGDNIYEVQVTADDGNGGTATQDFEVTVNDVGVSRGDEPNVVNFDPSEPLVHTLTGNTDSLVEVGFVVLNSGQSTEEALQAGADVRTVFSVLPDEFPNGEPGTFEALGQLKRILAITETSRVGYVLNADNDQTIDEILASGLSDLTNALEFGNFDQNLVGDSLVLEAGGVTFEVSQDDGTRLGANLQGRQNLEVFDLTSEGAGLTEDDTVTATLSFDLISVAAFDNVIGFYAVDNASGEIDGVQAGDEGYIDALLGNVITNENEDGEEEDIILKGGSTLDETEAGFSFELQGGQVVVPFIITRSGNLDELPDSSNELPLRSALYTPFVAANSDGADHFRLLADNTFGVEDLRGGGDQDFNDIIFQLDFAVA